MHQAIKDTATMQVEGELGQMISYTGALQWILTGNTSMHCQAPSQIWWELHLKNKKLWFSEVILNSYPSLFLGIKFYFFHTSKNDISDTSIPSKADLHYIAHK